MREKSEASLLLKVSKETRFRKELLSPDRLRCVSPTSLAAIAPLLLGVCMRWGDQRDAKGGGDAGEGYEENQ